MALRLRVDNRTRYATADLRRFFLWCIHREGAEGRTRRIEVVYSRKPGRQSYKWGQPASVHGLASYGGGWIRMKIPHGSVDGQLLARVVIHEIGHNLHLHHADMVDWWTLPIEDLPPELATFTESAPKAAPPPQDRDYVNLTKAQAAVARWASRLKRDRTWLKKWERKAKYYGRKIAAKQAACPNNGA